MLIFGTSSKVVQLAMLNLLCRSCGNPAAHGLRKRVMKFSLFFIPLFPVAPAKHSLQCTFCGTTSEVTKEDAEQLLAQSGQPSAQQPGMHGQPQSPYAQQPQQPQQPQQSPHPQQPRNPYGS